LHINNRALLFRPVCDAKVGAFQSDFRCICFYSSYVGEAAVVEEARSTARTEGAATWRARTGRHCESARRKDIDRHAFSYIHRGCSRIVCSESISSFERIGSIRDQLLWTTSDSKNSREELADARADFGCYCFGAGDRKSVV